MSFEREEIRRARKAHTCEGIWPEVCQGTVEPGELYLYCAGYLGDGPTFRTAAICQACGAYNHGEAGANRRWLCLVERKYPVQADAQQLLERRERCERANALIQSISQCGRNFFQHAGNVSALNVADSGTVYLSDAGTGTRTDTRWPDRWMGFSEGGTLRRLVEALAEFITTGEPLGGSYLSPGAHTWDPWGYGQSMDTVRRRRPAGHCAGGSMTTEPSQEAVHLMGVHRHCFRPWSAAEILGLSMFTPEGAAVPRACFHVRYDDGAEDQVLFAEAINPALYEVGSKRILEYLATNTPSTAPTVQV